MLKKSSGSYLKYAIGEITLVVVGILIAVSLNNWNSNRKHKKELVKIFEGVAEDIKQDTAVVNSILNIYEPLEEDVLSVVKDSMSENELENCRGCQYFFLSYQPFTVNTTGYNQLKDYKNTITSESDTLVTHTVQFYSALIKMTTITESLVEEDVKDNIKVFKNNHAWFADIMLGKKSKEYRDYMINGTDYRNRMANHYNLVFENYLPVLKKFKESAGKLLQDIDRRINI